MLESDVVLLRVNEVRGNLIKHRFYERVISREEGYLVLLVLCRFGKEEREREKKGRS